MTAYRRTRVAWAISLFLPLQLLVGGFVVLYAQRDVTPNTIVEQRLSDDVTAVDARVKKIEDLHLEGRLAVLDSLSERSWRIELLVIGLLLTTAGTGFLQAWMHRVGSGPYRHGRFDDKDDAA